YFYPKDNTPGCTKEACDFEENAEALKKAKSVVLGVSRDSIASHGRFVEKYGLSFPLLSDPDTVVCKAYGVYRLKKNYGREYWGIERSTFIIGLDGKLIQLYRRVKVKGHAEAVLADLKAAQVARKRKKTVSKNN
ncbi:peroxiredoxin, partial [Nitrospira defluvii]|nr:peroxiredoxin [Nitrospira defluvii]